MNVRVLACAVGLAVLALPASRSLAAAAAGGEAPAPRPFAIIAADPAFETLIAPDAKLEPVASFPGASGEGPLWRKGKLWFSDQRGGKIHELALDGTSRVLAENAGGPIDPKIRLNQGTKGLAAWSDGSVLILRQSLRDVAKLNADGTITEFLHTFEGKRFNSPNDLIVGKDGALWFTDPPIGLPGFGDPPGSGPPPDKQIPFSGVFRYKDGKLTAAATDMDQPNGIGLSPDGRTLYVANSRPDMYVRAYAVAADGSLSNPRDLIRIPTDTPWGRGFPDGLRVDAKGDVWVTGPGGIIVLAPDGKLLGRIQLPAGATNLNWGDDFKTLFLTSGGNILKLKTRVEGQVPPFYQR